MHLRRFATVLSVVAIAMIAAAACTSRPISMSATAGTTIVFPFGPDAPGFPVGYAGLGREDRQFGNTIFVLRKYQSGPPADPDHQCSGEEYTLPVRWVTRAWPDPASPAGISHAIDGWPGIQGQVLAALDIPASVPYGLYCWSIRNEVANPAAPAETEGDVFRFMAGQPLAQMGYFEVVLGLPLPNFPNLLEGFFDGATYTLDAGMADLIPYHKVAYEVYRTGSSDLPASADLTFTYPKQKIEVKTVYEENQLGRGSILRWRAIATPDPIIDELQIWYVDPDRSIARFSIVFDVKPNQTPIWTADFTEYGGNLGVKNISGTPQAKYYDLAGSDISATSGVYLVGVW